MVACVHKIDKEWSAKVLARDYRRESSIGAMLHNTTSGQARVMASAFVILALVFIFASQNSTPPQSYVMTTELSLDKSLDLG